MDTKRLVALGAAALMTGVLLLSSGCVRVDLEALDETNTDNESVSLGDADVVKVSIDMGAGQLLVDSDPMADLMDAEFTYRPSSLKPDVDYEVSGDLGAAHVGTLRVKTPSHPQINFGVNTTYKWDIGLAEGVPMSLDVDMGAGEANLVLGDLILDDLQIDLGAGDATIDLSGDPTRDLDADINAGVGQLTLIVPRDVGVRIIGHDEGIGDYQADGFMHDGDYLVNEAYVSAAVTFEISLHRGVGEVVIRMAD